LKKIKVNGRDVEVVFVLDLGNSLVYDLKIDGLNHRVTVGLDGADPVASLIKEAERAEANATKRKNNRKALKDAGFDD